METKLGPSEMKRERGRENREGTRERECPSNGYTETEREIEGAREDSPVHFLSPGFLSGLEFS